MYLGSYLLQGYIVIAFICLYGMLTSILHSGNICCQKWFPNSIILCKGNIGLKRRNIHTGTSNKEAIVLSVQMLYFYNTETVLPKTVLNSIITVWWNGKETHGCIQGFSQTIYIFIYVAVCWQTSHTTNPCIVMFYCTSTLTVNN